MALVTALLYWDQAALLYVISTLAMCGLLIVVAFSDLKGSRKELKGTAGQDEVSPAGGGETATTAALPPPERRVAGRKRPEAA